MPYRVHTLLNEKNTMHGELPRVVNKYRPEIHRVMSYGERVGYLGL